MIRGYFRSVGGRNRPFLDCDFAFPGVPDARATNVRLLVDTGADSTLLAPRDAIRTGIDFSTLARGPTSRGIGGETNTLLVESEILVQGHTISLTLSIPEAQRPIPSVLGRDFITNFALFLEERTGRVLFLDGTDVEMHGLATLGNP